MTVYHLDSKSFKVRDGEVVADWDGEGEHTVLLAHAAWCGYCKKTVPEFIKAAEQYNSVAFALIDDVELKKMSKSLPVSGFPSFFLVNKDDGAISKLDGFPREAAGMIDALKNM
jgi:thiol-disulfide isomerase/thioredoxin